MMDTPIPVSKEIRKAIERLEQADWDSILSEHDLRVPYHCCSNYDVINEEDEKEKEKDMYNKAVSEWFNSCYHSIQGVDKGTLVTENSYCCIPARYEGTRIPLVSKVETYNDRVVKVTFVDGSFTKSVCAENDIFDLDVGITICLMKRWLGKDGNKLYNNMLRDIHKKMESNEKEKEKEAAEKRERKTKQRKAELKKAAKKAKERQEQIDIQKTAMVEAMRVINTQTGDDMK